MSAIGHSLPQKIDTADLVTQVASGVVLHEYLEEKGIPFIRVWELMQADPLFAQSLASARSESWDNLAERLYVDAKRATNPGLARVALDAGKFLLAARKPHVYGQRVDINVEHTIRIDDALREAKARAVLPVRDQQMIEDAQIIEQAVKVALPAPDCESEPLENGDAEPDVWD